MGIKIKQHDITDCGAACIASVSAHYKLKLPIAKIRQYASTDKKGTNILGMVRAAEKLGFSAKGVKGNLDSLTKIPLPTIAHVIVKKVMQHFVVIYKVADTAIIIMDPSDGKMHKYTIEEWREMWTGVLVLMAPNQEFSTGNEKVSILSRFLYLLKPHKSILIQALFGAIIYTILGLSVSIYIQKITDHVLIDGNYNLLNLLSVAMILLLTMQIFISVFKSIFVLKTGQKIDAQLILGYYSHLLTLPQRFFDTMRTGEIISRLNDAVKIRVFINDVIIILFVNIFIVLFSFILMFTYYWKLALVILSIIPFHIIVYLITNNLNKRTERRLMENAADLESQLVESLNNIKTIKQFAIEGYTNVKTENSFVRLLHTTYTSGLNSLFSTNSTEFINRLFVIILLWIGSSYVIDRHITPGELLSFYTIIGYFTSPISGLVNMNKIIQNALIAADRLFEIMDLDKVSNEDKIDLTNEQVGDIVFSDVDFSYGTRTQVFNKLSLKIEKGKFTSVIGESGSGKTTLMAILQRLYPISSGHISIGNYDIDHLSVSSLRDIVSVVPQDIHLFTGNIIENIALGEFNPEMNKIINISNALGITEFIKELPNGFDTHLGEHGANLSGGQRQRIAIARALYKNPEIIIFDEATSALDSISEYYVQKTIEDLKSLGKTIIVISHRLNTNMNADSILVLENGKLIEQGNHTELLTRQGKYFQLWNQKMKGTETSDLDIKRSPLNFPAKENIISISHRQQYNSIVNSNYSLKSVFFVALVGILGIGFYFFKFPFSFTNSIMENKEFKENTELSTSPTKNDFIGKLDSIKRNKILSERSKYQLYQIQVGRFKNEINVSRLVNRLEKSGFKVLTLIDNDKLTKVVVQCSEEDLPNTLDIIRSKFALDAFVLTQEEDFQ